MLNRNDIAARGCARCEHGAGLAADPRDAMRHEAGTADPPEVMALDRTRLRRPRLSDADAIFEFGCDPEVARYADWPVCTTIDSVVEIIRLRREQWSAGIEFSWIITLPAEDQAIGSVSCRVQQHAADFGYVLNRRYWRNGYATEVSRAVVEWVFSVPSILRLSATCDTENIASVRVLEKSGLSREGIMRRSIVRPQISNEPRDAFLYSKVRE